MAERGLWRHKIASAIREREPKLTATIVAEDGKTQGLAKTEVLFTADYPCVNRENFEAMQGFHAGWRKSDIGGAEGKQGLGAYLQTHVACLQGH